MADQTTAAGTNSEAAPPRAPRWVKVFGFIAIVLVAAFVLLKLTGAGGEHGPGRHTGPARTTPSSVPAHRPPPGVPGHGP